MTTFADLDIGCPLKLPPPDLVRHVDQFEIAIWNEADHDPQARSWHGTSGAYRHFFGYPNAISNLLHDRAANPHGNEEP